MAIFRLFAMGARAGSHRLPSCRANRHTCKLAGTGHSVSEPGQLTRGINPILPPPKQSSSSLRRHEGRPPERSLMHFLLWRFVPPDAGHNRALPPSSALERFPPVGSIATAFDPRPSPDVRSRALLPCLSAPPAA